GITTDIPRVPSAALGAADVRPIDLVTAYAAFANGGNRVAPHFIRRIVDRHGNTVWEASVRSVPVLDPAQAFVLTSMLQDVVDRGTGTAVRAVGFRGAAAGKTGTTNDAADVWFVGYPPELVAGVWIGLDRRQTIVRGASGGTLAAPVWGRLMRRVYADRPLPQGWSPPPGVRTAEVLRATGEVENPQCPTGGETYTEYFLSTPPAPRYCDNGYPSYSLDRDTLWGDEEWGSELPPLDTIYADSGIDWPELEALRRRAADSLSYPLPPGADTLGVEVTRELPPAVDPVTGEKEGDEAGELEPDTGEEREVLPREPPRVLGVPVP